MYLSVKVKGHHANLVENAIRNIKRRLYLIMRTSKSKNWDKDLKGNITNQRKKQERK